VGQLAAWTDLDRFSIAFSGPVEVARKPIDVPEVDMRFREARVKRNAALQMMQRDFVRTGLRFD
jgi:hypothetical protein